MDVGSLSSRELYELLVPELQSSSLETNEEIVSLQNDFEILSPDYHAISQSLPKLSGSINEEITWYMRESIDIPKTKQEKNDNNVHRKIVKTYPLLLSDQQNENEEEDEEPDYVYIYLTPKHPPIEFVYLKPNNNENFVFDQPPEDVIEDAHFIKTMKRYSELAKGAYALDEKMLQERTALQSDKIFNYDFQESSGTFPRPAFFLAIDEQLKCLVLSIRGTKTKIEMQIDAQWEPIQFLQYENSYVHQGILLSTRWFIDNILSRLLQLSRLFPDYKIRVVGHSLGGGIAALFTLMTKDILPGVKCVVFAPPACISGNLVKLSRECCVSFVNRNDVLPYLTHAKFTSFFFGGKFLDESDKLSSSGGVPKDGNKRLRSYSTLPLPPATPSSDNQQFLVQLYPPGELFHIFKSQAESFHIRRVPFDYFTNRKFPLTRTMVRHHKLDSYRHAFNTMAESPLCTL